VQYGRLADIGRRVVARQVARPLLPRDDQGIRPCAGRRSGLRGQGGAHVPCREGRQRSVAAVRRALCADSHLCCGSAGTYSVLHKDVSLRLRDDKLARLQATCPERIVSANIGCITHLQSGTDVPVEHWVELLDRALQ
jgi:hypothetical protein